MKLAAIDLGSNSFRLEIARVEGERIITEGSWKETIRLAAGIDKDGNLTPEAQDRGLNALARIAEKIRGLPRNHIRAVGTQTLRAAKNSQEFIERAERILDCKVEILRGKEEARLVFQGCSFALPPSNETRLIVDIGGASTECVIGRGHDMIEGESFHVGCVNTSVTFFKDRKITAQSMRRAILSATSVLDGSEYKFVKGNWQEAFGSSGTVSAVSSILAALKITDGSITLYALEQLKDRLIHAESIDKIKFDGLKEDRREVLAGGIAVLIAVFNKLKIDVMKVADGALRYGILYDLAGRKLQRDPREASVERMMAAFHVDKEQAKRVGDMAVNLLKTMSSHVSEDSARFLRWAADLHETGLTLSRSDYHKHSEYLIKNSDIAGFSRPEQEKLAALVLGHRGNLKKVEMLLAAKQSAELLFCLRIATIVAHARQEIELPKLEATFHGHSFCLYVPRAWLKDHPDISLIPGVLQLRYLENRGMAFGLFEGKIPVFVILCLLFFGVFIYVYARIPTNRYYLPLSVTALVMVSGALGNFIDRVCRGYVVDFIYFSLIDFPVFNIADMYVVCSGILLVMLVCFRYKNDEDYDFLRIKKD